MNKIDKIIRAAKDVVDCFDPIFSSVSVEFSNRIINLKAAISECEKEEMTFSENPEFKASISVSEKPASVEIKSPEIEHNPIIRIPGMKKREYFAAMALQGFCAANPKNSIEEYVKVSLQCADELIKQLSIPQDK